MNELVLGRKIGSLIHFIRGQKVMLDGDLAALYGVSTKDFNRAVKRHRERFPSDFMFQLSPQEWKILRCQFGTSSWGGRRYAPLAFTEHGVAMLSSVLNSARAAQVNIAIMRAFVKLRKALSANRGLSKRLDDIERQLAARADALGENVGKIAAVLTAIKRLMEPPSQPSEEPPQPPKPRIGFNPDG